MRIVGEVQRQQGGTDGHRRGDRRGGAGADGGPLFHRYFGTEAGVGLRSMPWQHFCSVGAAFGYSPTEFARALEQRAVGLNA